jgi:hypothetical protein
MQVDKLRLAVRSVCLTILFLIGGFSVFKNYPLFGVTVNLTERELSDLTPGARVKKVLASDSEVKKQVEDLIYFTTKSKGYDKATVRISFLSGGLDQEVHLGFKDQRVWHYKTKPVYLPLLENLKWQRVNFYSPTLYQKEGTAVSFEEFIKNPPTDKVVGTYYLSESYARENLDGYKPKSERTKIDVPLRGSHSFFTYVQDEPFFLKVGKQDLNWYDGADRVRIVVTKDGKILQEKTIADDGINNASQQFKDIQYETLEYVGGNAPNGLYRVQIIASADSIIKYIESSFSLMSFQGPIFAISGSDAYNPELAKGSPNTLYTDALKLTFRTSHSAAFQKIKINNDEIDISEVDKDFTYDSKSSDRNVIQIPEGDVFVDGVGYFSFATDQFFTPFIYKKYEVKGKDDLEKIDYLLTDYVKPFNMAEGWREAELTFDIKDAFYDKDKLSWIIRAPGLKTNGNSVLIKDIEVTLEKEPIIN